MLSFEERLAAMHEDPAYKSASTAERLAADQALSEKVRAESAQRSAQGLQQNAAKFGFAGRAANTLGAFGAGLTDTATAGYGAPLGAALSSGLSAIGAPEVMGGTRSTPEIQGEQDALMAQSPLAAGAGRIAGSFVGPIAQGVSAVGNAVGAAARPVANLAAQVVENEFGRRLLSNLITNTASGAASVASYEFGKYQDTSGLAERLNRAATGVKDMATSPAALGLLAGGSLLQTKYTPPIDAKLATAIDRYERVSGQKVPVEILTNDANKQGLYDMLARIDKSTVQKQRDEAIKGLGAYIDDIAKQGGAATGGQEATRGGAASAVRSLVGTREEPGPITAQRRETVAAAMEADRQLGPSQAAASVLKNAIDEIRASRPEGVDSGLEPLLKKLEGFEGRGIGVDSLDGLTRENAGLAKFATHPPNEAGAVTAGRTMYESGLLQKAFALARQQFPEYTNAMSLSQKLHRMEDAVSDVKVVHVDDAMMQNYFSRLTPESWQSLQQYRPEDVAAARGWYYYRLVNQLAGANGDINPARLKKVMSAPGSMFNSQRVDEVLPGMRQELQQYAELSSTMMTKGRFRAEGSDTFGRSAQAGKITAGLSTGTASFLTGALSSAGSLALALLGPTGVRFVIRQALGGMINDAMQKSIRQGPVPFSRGAVAASQTLPGVPFGTPPRPQLLTTLPNQVQGGNQ